MVFHQQVADLPSVLRLTQILTSCGTNIEMSANLKAIWSVKMAPLNSHVESPARTLSMSSCTRSPQLENGFCMLRSLRGAWTGKNTMSNMVCICLVSFPTPTGKLSKRFVTAGGSFEEKILGIWESIQAFYLLPTHYGPAAQKTQSWQASWYFFKVVKLQQGVALYDYQHGSKLGDFFFVMMVCSKIPCLICQGFATRFFNLNLSVMPPSLIGSTWGPAHVRWCEWRHMGGGRDPQWILSYILGLLTIPSPSR